MIEKRIYGPPGTGKTTRIKRLVAELIESGVDPHDIYATSFSRAGAAELVERLGLPKKNVGTIHSFAYKGLGLQSGDMADDHLEEFSKQHPFYRMGAQYNADPLDFNGSDFVFDDKAPGARLLNKLNIYRNLLTEFFAMSSDVQAFAKAWTAWKKDEGLYDFVDLIESVSSAQLPEGEVLICDEAQDLSPLELGKLRRWGESFEQLVLAGDPNQAIYSFKGVEPEAFMLPELPRGQIEVLGQSYRVPVAVHDLARGWQQFDFRYRPRPVPGKLVKAAAVAHSPEFFIKRLLEGEGSRMIIASCSYMLEDIRQYALREGVPFHNPYQPDKNKWNPLDQYLGGKIANFGPGTTNAELWSLVKDLPAKLFAERGAKGLLKALAKTEADDPADARRWLSEHLLNALSTRDPGRLVSLYQTQLPDRTGKHLKYTLQALARYGSSAVETPRLTLGTVHSVKGGEADRVLLFPSQSKAAWQDYHWRPWSTRRVIYTGITRAKSELWLGAPVLPAVDFFLSAPNGYEETKWV